MYTSSPSVATLAVATSAAVFLFASALIGVVDDVRAEAPTRKSLHDAARSTPGHGESMPHDGQEALRGSAALPEPVARHEPRPLPALPYVMPRAEPGDDIAALDAIDIALKQVGDGASYVWHRGGGRIAGAIRVTTTFRDAEGRICRHLEMQMRLGSYTRRTEGIACRGADQIWLLEG